MPAEVFTISGADFGAPASYPAALRTDSGGGSASAPPPVLLQNALKALGTAHGDGQLTSVRIDGVIGPATVKAVNYALAHYIGSTPGFLSANLTLDKVRQYAGALAAVVAEGVRKSGGTVPAPQMAKPMVRHPKTGALVPVEQVAPPSDNRWIWWAVGGVGTLLILTLAVKAVQKRRLQAA